jgi:hypothetical protein
MKITKRQLLQIIREEKAESTVKHNADDRLTGDQTKLPDALQKAIIDKEEEKEKKDESAQRQRLRQIILDECPEGMSDEPEMADDLMQLAPEPALPDAHGHQDGGMPCPIKTAAKMKESGATEQQLMDFVSTLIQEFKMGGTTVPEQDPMLGQLDDTDQDITGDLLSILGL